MTITKFMAITATKNCQISGFSLLPENSETFMPYMPVMMVSGAKLAFVSGWNGGRSKWRYNVQICKCINQSSPSCLRFALSHLSDLAPRLPKQIRLLNQMPEIFF